MRMFVEAATGLPGILFTAALVVAACFWLLAALGVVAVNTFDTDVDLDAWGMGGVPVTVALSLLAALAWLLNTGLAFLVTVEATPGAVAGVLRLAASAGALLVAWWLTCLSVRPLREAAGIPAADPHHVLAPPGPRRAAGRQEPS
ncbi:hypothetical protein [Streptomyces sp. NPDC005385]|uniref:hypothetical protein n=1 Tax=Streptomyces sp. NPDC005385 TaxID=3157039 RepID=UPI0033B3D109